MQRRSYGRGVAGDSRAVALARHAAGLAASAGIDLPDDLRLWALAGGRPAHSVALPSRDPAQDLGDVLERALSPGERRAGAHFTPTSVADAVAALALSASAGRPTVVDPACGGGALLLAAGRRLAAEHGLAPAGIARELLWGADIDALAVAVTEAAIALWSGGVVPAAGHLVVGDTLCDGRTAWVDPPPAGFEVVLGNPPFQGQLARATARSREAVVRLRTRYGAAVAAYVDTAALFLLAGVDLAAAGGRVALLQPQSVIASRDAGRVRAALADQARLVELWAPAERLFDARVHVCVPVLEVGPTDVASDWTAHLATARGTPSLCLPEHGTVGDLATAVAGFRDEYYGLVDHVREAGERATAPLVTSGVIGVGTSAWGERSVRFAKRVWARPEVDLASLSAANPRVRHWVQRVRRPKVVVASQTRIVQAAADRVGDWVPCTPVVSVLPEDPHDVDALAAVLCAPPIAAWAARRTAGTALSPHGMRIPAALALDVPLPGDRRTWARATALLAAADLAAYAEAATAMFALPPGEAQEVLDWWWERAQPTWPLAGVVR